MIEIVLGVSRNTLRSEVELTWYFVYKQERLGCLNGREAPRKKWCFGGIILLFLTIPRF